MKVFLGAVLNLLLDKTVESRGSRLKGFQLHSVHMFHYFLNESPIFPFSPLQDCVTKLQS